MSVRFSRDIVSYFNYETSDERLNAPNLPTDARWPKQLDQPQTEESDASEMTKTVYFSSYNPFLSSALWIVFVSLEHPLVVLFLFVIRSEDDAIGEFTTGQKLLRFGAFHSA